MKNSWKKVVPILILTMTVQCPVPVFADTPGIDPNQDPLAPTVPVASDSTGDPTKSTVPDPNAAPSALAPPNALSPPSSADNQPPTITPPQNLEVDEDKRLFIEGIQIADDSSRGELYTLTLTVSYGILTIRDDIHNGVNANEITGNGTHLVTIVSTLFHINKTLAGLRGVKYVANQDYNRRDTLGIEVTDQYGATATAASNISINPVNDPPQVTVPADGTLIGDEDAPFFIHGLDIQDPDVGQIYTVTLKVHHGTLFIKEGIKGGLDWGSAQGNGTDTVVITATLNEILVTLHALHGVKYAPDADYNGADTISMNVVDAGGAERLGKIDGHGQFRE